MFCKLCFAQPTLPSFDEAKAQRGERFADIGGKFLDTHVYTQRIRLAADAILLDADARAAKQKRQVFFCDNTRSHILHILHITMLPGLMIQRY